MPTVQRPRAIEFLRLLQEQSEVDAKPYHDLRVAVGHQLRAFAKRGLHRARPSTAARMKLREWDRSGGPFEFALAWTAERLTCPILDGPLRDKTAEAVIQNLWGDQFAVVSVLVRAIAIQDTDPKARLKLSSDDWDVMEVMRQLARFDEDGRTVELLAVMKKRYPHEARKREWPTPLKPGEGAATAGYEGYAPADTIRLEHGIPKPRLSEGKRAGKIKWKPAPAGIRDTEGRAVRVYYHVADALAARGKTRLRHRWPLLRGEADQGA